MFLRIQFLRITGFAAQDNVIHVVRISVVQPFHGKPIFGPPPFNPIHESFAVETYIFLFDL